MTFNELIDQLNAQLTHFAEVVGEDVVSGNIIDEANFEKGAGSYVNSPIAPWTDSTIPLTVTGAVRGGFVSIWYKGPVLAKANFTGGTIVVFSGENNLNELCRVFIDCDKSSGAFSVSIQVGFTGDFPIPINGPNVMSIISIEAAYLDGPATMEITEIN